MVNYDSRRTRDRFLDTGSTPVCSMDMERVVRKHDPVYISIPFDAFDFMHYFVFFIAWRRKRPYNYEE